MARLLTKLLNIPLITLAATLSEQIELPRVKGNFVVTIQSPSDVQGIAMRDLVSNMNITDAAILYDDSYYTLDTSADLLLVDLPVKYLALRLGSTVYRKPNATEAVETAESQFQTLASLSIRNFIIFAHPLSVCPILRAVENLGMFTRRFSWAIFSKVRQLPNCKVEEAQFLYAGADLKKTLLTDDKQLGLSDTMNPVDIAFWNQAANSVVDVFRSTKAKGSTKLPWNSNVCSTGNFSAAPAEAKKMLDEFSEKMAKDKSFERSNDSDHLFQVGMSMILERYNISDGKINKEEVGKWSNNEWVAENETNLTVYGAALIYRVVVVEQAPFVVKIESPNGTDTFEGYCIDLLKELQERLGFEYEVYESPDGLYGSLAENGSWSGMIKEVMEKKADIALGALSVTAERETVIDFTIPYYDLVGITILMKKPIIPTSLFKFLTVLENEVWGCILGAYFLTSSILWLFDRFSPYSYTNDPERYVDDEEKRKFNIKESLWFCMTSLTPQGGGEAPKHLSGRLVSATWWLFAFIIVSSYTANLAAFLTVSRLETPVKSLDDLVTQYKIKYAPLEGSSAMAYFERMAGIENRFYEIWKNLSFDDSMPESEKSELAVWDYPVSDKYTKMWQTIQDNQMPINISEALDRVRDMSPDGRGFAFLGDATDIRYLVMKNCDLVMVGEEFSRRPYALAVQDGSPLKDQLNEAILKLLNLRRLESLKDKWWTENPSKAKCPAEASTSEGISIENIGGVFIVILVGIILSIIVLIIEYIYYKYYHKEDGEDDEYAASTSTAVASPSDKTKNNDWNSKIMKDEIYPVTAW
ncbi:ionotropic receptor 25a-like isoform X1 [Artemia franciscana]|uniref:ionotropic receptor 25a-like isoform X1 n=1 Tax=Artemia franciscana TaxID=6661 RepID=UPI0032DBA434